MKPLFLDFARQTDTDNPHLRPNDQTVKYTWDIGDGDKNSFEIEWSKAFFEELTAISQKEVDAAVVQRHGNRLRDFLGASWAVQEAAIEAALLSGESIRITIRSAAEELYILPWDLLTLSNGEHLFARMEVLLRYAAPATRTIPEQPCPRPEGGRILFAWSDKGGIVPYDGHLAAIEKACRRGNVPFDPQRDILHDVSLASLDLALRDGPPVTVLHILCHGEKRERTDMTFGLAWHASDSKDKHIVDARQLETLLKQYGSSLRLVVLCACESANIGKLGNPLGSPAIALHKAGIQSVLASRFVLSQQASELFFGTFYDELLGTPASLEASFLKARQSVLPMTAKLAWASLQLYARPEDGEDTRPVVFRPYRGLLPFEAAHARFFFGRSAEISELIANLQALQEAKRPRLLVVAGASGTGKSSVVLAGVIPKLVRSTDGSVKQDATLDFLARSVESLEAFLQPRSGDTALKQSLDTLRRKLSSMRTTVGDSWQAEVLRPGASPLSELKTALDKQQPGHQFLLVIDQFEELFTQTSDPAVRQEFAHKLWQCCQGESGVHCIITIRVDFLGRCGELPLNNEGLRLDRVAYDEAHRIFVAQFQPEQLRAAIVEPAAKVGLVLDAGLADSMLADVGHEPGALPLLEDALDVLWQNREGHRLTQAAYKLLGSSASTEKEGKPNGVIGALQRRADATVAKLNPEERSIAQHLLVRLVSVAEVNALDTRRRLGLDELRRSFSDGAALDRVLREFVEARLLVQGGDPKNVTVEVAHEALIRSWPLLRSWLNEDRADLLLQRRISEAAKAWKDKEDSSLLYRGTQLANAKDWQKRWQLRAGKLELEFLDESEKLREQQEREVQARQERERRNGRYARLAAGILGVFFIASVVSGYVAQRKSREARAYASEALRSAQEAARQSAVAKQRAREAHDSQLLAVAQLSKSNPAQATSALREAANKSSPYWIQSALELLDPSLAIPEVVLSHPDSVTSVTFSQDGKRIITGCRDSTVRIWDAQGIQSPLLLKAASSAMMAQLSALSSDGKLFAAGYSDGGVSVWDSDNLGEPRFQKSTQGLAHLAISLDGKRVAISSFFEPLRIWNVADKRKLIEVPTKGLSRLLTAFGPDGKQIAIGSDDKNLCVRNLEGDGKPIKLRGQVGTITSIAFSPDGQRIATGADDNMVRIWNVEGFGWPLTLQGHQAPVVSLAFSLDGKMLATGSADATARIWSVRQEDEDVREALGFELQAKEIAKIPHPQAVTRIAFSPDGQKVVSSCGDRSVCIWNIERGVKSFERTKLDRFILAASVSADGQVAFLPSDKILRIRSGERDGQPKPIRADKELLTKIALSPDGKRVATVSHEGTVRILSVEQDSQLLMSDSPRESVDAIAFSPDGTKLGAGCENGMVRIWDVQRAGESTLLKGHTDAIYSVAFSGDGKKVGAGAADGTVRIWNLEQAGDPLVLKGNTAPVGSIAFGRDGKIAAASGDTIFVWSAAGPGNPLVLKGHLQAVNFVAFSPDGTQIASGATDKVVRIWNANGVGASVVLKEHQASVGWGGFSADKKRLLTLDREGNLYSWTVASEALDSALWDATPHCLPLESRREVLFESIDEAKLGNLHCRQEVARHRGWPVPKN